MCRSFGAVDQIDLVGWAILFIFLKAHNVPGQFSGDRLIHASLSSMVVMALGGREVLQLVFLTSACKSLESMAWTLSQHDVFAETHAGRC